MITIEEPNEVKPSREAIALLETNVGLQLPAEYKKFLIDCNGGYPEPNYIKIGDFVLAVQVFYGIQVERMDDLQVRLKVLAGRIPDRSLPIAALEGGDVLVIGLDRNIYGQIFWWEHEIEENKINKLRFVANSFDELMENLSPDNDV